VHSEIQASLNFTAPMRWKWVIGSTSRPSEKAIHMSVKSPMLRLARPALQRLLPPARAAFTGVPVASALRAYHAPLVDRLFAAAPARRSIRVSADTLSGTGTVPRQAA
jgi:hypothetical protein